MSLTREEAAKKLAALDVYPRTMIDEMLSSRAMAKSVMQAMLPLIGDETSDILRAYLASPDDGAT